MSCFDLTYAALAVEGEAGQLSELVSRCNLNAGTRDEDKDYVIRNGSLIMEDWCDGCLLHWMDGVSMTATELGCTVTWLLCPSANETEEELLEHSWESARRTERDRRSLFRGFVSNDFRMKYIELIPYRNTYRVGLKDEYSFRKDARCS